MSRFFKWLSLICLVVAIIFIAQEPIRSHLVNSYRPKVTKTIIHKDRNKAKRATYNMNNVQSATTSKIIKARANANQVAVVGQMLVPSVGLHLPINAGVTNNSLLLGAGTMKSNDIMGQSNYVLAGHHMINKEALFTPLWYHAHIGTNVYITNMNKLFMYKINTRKIISPYDTNIINSTTAPKITLITCNNNGTKRLLLQGRLVKQMHLKHAHRAILRDLESNTNNHQVLKGY